MGSVKSHLTLEGGRVLVAEDDPILCELICEILVELGAHADGVHSGDAALARFVERQHAKENYDAVIVDLRLPTLSGTDTLAQLRRLNDQILLVAISGSPPNPEMRLALEKNRIAFLPKPFGLTGLAAVFNRPHLNG